MFNGAHDFIINGGEFIGVQNNYIHGPSGIEILLESSTPDASIDSEARRYAPTCYPGTREQYITDITNWATGPSNDDRSPSIYWMRGPAGVGKSAIAQTCAERVQQVDQLGAAYFFCVGLREDENRFFTTIAYQLSTVFPEYRRLLDERVKRDKTLVKKTLVSQFKLLIVEPLKELQSRDGKGGIGRRTIFIDGLDECQSKEAQSEIIEIIASSIREQTTPFRWAIFSRPEPHIIATFTKPNIFPLCRAVWLPISREADGEIALYLRGGFDDILRRRNISPSSPWPTEEVIWMLVNASAGLFAYPAAVIRFIDQHPALRIEEPLHEVLGIISERDGHSSGNGASPFAQLDAFYMLIMKRIPESVLSSVLVFLADVICSGYFGAWYAALTCNKLGLSEGEFKAICNHLHAVMYYEDPPKPLILDASIDVTRSYYNQKLSTEYNPIHYNRPHATQQVYASSFDIRGSSLALTSTVPNSSMTLSWPQGLEYIDSFIKSWVFTQASVDLSHNSRPLFDFLEAAPPSLSKQLKDLDYRKYLIAELEVTGEGYWNGHCILGTRGRVRIIPGTMLGALTPDEYGTFDSAVFMKVVKKLEKLGVIRPYYPDLPLSFASIRRSFSRQPRSGNPTCGQYKLGCGDRAIYWYWEFDAEKRYFHQFDTLDFVKAMKVYQEQKVSFWVPT
ncbi:hypothetical protein NP233_g10750 [Leucocoprinus birnbaumii]|uniref:Nephrocystin 3-like N-terminal domain-containing protein n=1 Tax=Leucocoprinus birnbaumii TaxID=56174 RepID=A0AAD5YRL7_9AGAR|nr:hypothetical protein NP233_g10750 [Leucocoprinus birnbaumii]